MANNIIDKTVIFDIIILSKIKGGTIMENITLAPIKLKKMTKEEAIKKGEELLALG